MGRTKVTKEGEDADSDDETWAFKDVGIVKQKEIENMKFDAFGSVLIMECLSFDRKTIA